MHQNKESVQSCQVSRMSIKINCAHLLFLILEASGSFFKNIHRPLFFLDHLLIWSWICKELEESLKWRNWGQIGNSWPVWQMFHFCGLKNFKGTSALHDNCRRLFEVSRMVWFIVIWIHWYIQWSALYWTF